MYEAAAQTQQPCLVVMQVLEERLQASCQASTAKVVAEWRLSEQRIKASSSLDVHKGF